MIRPSQLSDANAVVPLIDIVFEEMEVPALMKMEKPALYAVFEEAFALPGYRYSTDNTFVYEENGEVLGIAVGYPHEAEAHIDDAFTPMLSRLGLDASQPLFPDPESQPGEWYLDTFAVAESAQGRGIGTKILTGVEPLVKAQGYSVISLNVDQANPRAEKLYRRFGYEKNGELMIGSHRYNHMVKTI